MRALGNESGISKSQVSRICGEIDEVVAGLSIRLSDVPQNSGVLEPGREGRSLATCAGTLEG